MKTLVRVILALALAVVLVLLIPGRTPREPVPGPRLPFPTAARISSTSQFAACTAGFRRNAVNYTNAEVEPSGAVNPRDPSNLVVSWQQDRWSDGGARALPIARSDDGGATWKVSTPYGGPRVTICSGGNEANGGDYERASDPWVSFAPNGDLYHSSLSFNRSNDRNAVLISKSTDGGETWSEPVTVKEDVRAFNDKETVTADPHTPPNGRRSAAYVVWSREGDAWFSRTTDGESWEPARSIFREGFSVGHQLAVHTSGRLIDIFSLFKSQSEAYIAVLRSIDEGPARGDSWSDAVIVSRFRFAAPRDPDTNAKIRAGEGLPDIAVDRQTGVIYAAWQDLLFEASGKRRNAIAFSESRDAGETWSRPIRINRPQSSLGDVNDEAFTPTVHVADDGTVAVSYYDFRQNTDAESVSTDYWVVRCRGRSVSCTQQRNWAETHVSGPFDIEMAPKSMGLFLGDYMAMASAGRQFLLFFVQSTITAANRTNVYARRI